MLTDEQTSALDQRKWVMLIIFGALFFGVLVFSVVSLIVRINGGEEVFNMEVGFIAKLGIAFACLVLIPSFVVPVFVRRSTMKEVSKKFVGRFAEPGAAAHCFAGIQTSMIVGLALLEGAAFFNLIGYLIEGSVGNIFAVAVLLTVMFIRIPLPGRVEQWVSNMLDDAKLEKK